MAYDSSRSLLHTRQPFTSSRVVRALRPTLAIKPQASAGTGPGRRCDEDLVRHRPPARRAAEKPVLAKIQPSSSYLYRSRQEQLGEAADDKWFETDDEPTEEISMEEERRRTRAAARDGLTKAVKVTAKAGRGLLNVALPISKWAVQTGFTAAANAVGKATSKNSKAPIKQQ
jgi:hypothetical protein